MSLIYFNFKNMWEEQGVFVIVGRVGCLCNILKPFQDIRHLGQDSSTCIQINKCELNLNMTCDTFTVSGISKMENGMHVFSSTFC